MCFFESRSEMMRVALISDIHSNYHAFKAVFEDAKKRNVSKFIFLGDYVSDLADPQKTMDLLYEIQTMYPTYCIRGNREGYMLDCYHNKSHFSYGSKSGSLLFTYNHLRDKDLSFYDNLKIADMIEIDGVKIEIAHAMVDNDRFYFHDESNDLEKIFENMQCQYFLTGHSHKQYCKKYLDKIIINPGSVGVPQNHKWLSQYAILDINNGELDCLLCEVPYDIEATIHAQFESGLVTCAKYWAIGILYDIVTGDDWVIELLKKVYEEKENPNEHDWYLAAMKMGMKFTEEEIIDFYKILQSENNHL